AIEDTRPGLAGPAPAPAQVGRAHRPAADEVAGLEAFVFPRARHEQPVRAALEPGLVDVEAAGDRAPHQVPAEGAADARGPRLGLEAAEPVSVGRVARQLWPLQLVRRGLGHAGDRFALAAQQAAEHPAAQLVGAAAEAVLQLGSGYRGIAHLLGG